MTARKATWSPVGCYIGGLKTLVVELDRGAMGSRWARNYLRGRDFPARPTNVRWTGGRHECRDCASCSPAASQKKPRMRGSLSPRVSPHGL